MIKFVYAQETAEKYSSGKFSEECMYTCTLQSCRTYLCILLQLAAFQESVFRKDFYTVCWESPVLESMIFMAGCLLNGRFTENTNNVFGHYTVFNIQIQIQIDRYLYIVKNESICTRMHIKNSVLKIDVNIYIKSLLW